MMEAFAKRYCDQNPGVFTSSGRQKILPHDIKCDDDNNNNNNNNSKGLNIL